MKFSKSVFILYFLFSSSVAVAGSVFNGKPFNGFYLGVQGGYGHADDEVSDTFGLGLKLDLGSSGGTYGLLGGWGTTLPGINPRIYAGIEGQYNKVDRDGEISIGIIPASIGWETDDMWNIGGRLGYLLSDDTMIFSRLAYASLESDISISPGGVASVDVDTLDGVQAGFGFEHHVGHNFTLRGEYVYSNYGSAGIRVPGLAPGDIAEVDVTSSEIRIALSYNFYQFPWQSGRTTGAGSTLSGDDLFNGFYFGFQGGYGHADDDTSGTLGIVGLSANLGSSGKTYGFHAGWGTTLPGVHPRFYAGLEGQYNKVDRDGSIFIGLLPAAVTWESDIMWSAGGRLGYLLSDTTLAYTRVAYVRLESDVSITPFAPFGINVDNFDGYMLGLGIEHHISENFSIRGEYNYADYGSADISVSGIGNIAEVDVTSSDVRVGISYRFKGL